MRQVNCIFKQQNSRRETLEASALSVVKEKGLLTIRKKTAKENTQQKAFERTPLAY
jgi:hypothetical protein